MHPSDALNGFHMNCSSGSMIATLNEPLAPSVETGHQLPQHPPIGSVPLPRNHEPDPMKHLPSLLTTLGTIALLAIPAHALPPPTSAATATVQLTGWLHVDDLEMRDVTLVVAVNGSRRTAHISNSGRFDLELPAESAVLLRFEKPGHVPKEVTVDTRNVQDGGFSKQQRRHVKLAVIMEQERFMGGLAFAGPVGRIGFEPGGGCVAVEHTRRTEPAKRREILEF